ncbi:MAG: hypothetical protein OQL08_06095 [Gammaproteobacteria bacterium]|nr:hypothetical protein [Gammaproteobacteria bacterium]
MRDIVIFETDNHQVEVRLQSETLWVTQSQMAELFATSTDNISLHLKNIYSDNELEESATTEDFSVVRQEGERQVRRSVKHYNPEATVAVWFQACSVRGRGRMRAARGQLSGISGQLGGKNQPVLDYNGESNR